MNLVYAPMLFYSYLNVKTTDYEDFKTSYSIAFVVAVVSIIYLISILIIIVSDYRKHNVDQKWKIP